MDEIKIGDVYRRVYADGKFQVFEIVEELRYDLYRFELRESDHYRKPNFGGNKNYAPNTVYSIGDRVIREFCTKISKELIKEITKEDIV